MVLFAESLTLPARSQLEAEILSESSCESWTGVAEGDGEADKTSSGY